MMILVCFSFFLLGFIYGLRGCMLDCPSPSLKIHCQLVHQLTTHPPQKIFLPWLLAACQGSLCIHSAEMRCSSWEFSDHSLCGSPLTSVVIFVEAQPDCRANTRLLI